MLKRLSVALAALFVLAAPCFAAGTIPYSLSQQFDQYGHVLAGCKLYIIQAGTVGTPQTAYQDSALTIPVSGGSQLTCDAAGRLPQFFLADGSIKILLTDANGVTQVSADGILVVGASSGGGGGSPVDPTTILTTGDVKLTYGTGVVTGFVRANGRTIGSATSGATERANSDTQALFLYLWGADANLTVSTGRGVSAAADWAANKTITLPDFRGRVVAGLDDMGNSAASRLTATYFGAAGGCSGVLGTTLGAACGGESHTLTAGESAVLAYTATINVQGLQTQFNTLSAIPQGSGSTNQTWIGSSTNGLATQPTYNVTANAGGNPHAVVQPTILTTYYIKL